MVEGESSIGRKPEQNQSSEKKVKDLLEGFCRVRGVENTTPTGNNTPADKEVIQEAFRLYKGEIDLEDEEQKEQLKNFLKDKEKKFADNPEELLKIKKLRWFVGDGQNFLSHDLVDEIGKVFFAEDEEGLEKAMDEANSAYKEIQNKYKPYEKDEKKEEEKSEEEEKIKKKSKDKEKKEQFLGELYIPRPDSKNFLTDSNLRDIARAVDAEEITIK
jgi:hypothetical protein